MEKTSCNNLKIEILDVLHRFPRNFVKVLESKRFKCLYDSIIKNTRSLEDTENFKYKLKTRIFWILNDIKDWKDYRVQCVVCKKPLKNIDVHHINDGYRKHTCCKKCERTLAQKRIEESMKKQYGVKNAFQLDIVKDGLKRHKVQIQDKRDKSKKKNKTFKTSKKEELAYKILCQIFGENDIVRQHKDIERYPFNCDFYIISKDLFIECNFSWTHGRHWFDENDKDDLQRLEKMKAKKSKYYDNAIDTWTRRDAEKRRCAEKNGLKYVVFWKIEDIYTYTKILQQSQRIL